MNNLFTKLAGEAKSEAASNDLYAIWLVIVNDTPPVEPPTTKVEGSKVWDDNNDRDGMRPESITVTLHADGKEVEEPCKPDDIPNDKLDAVVNEIQSEAQADKFVEASAKESVRAKGMNRKNAIAKELKDREDSKK